MGKLESRMVEYVSSVSFEDLTDDAILSAKKCTLDIIAAMLAGSTASGIDIIVGLADSWRGAQDSTLIGFGRKLPTPLAAWCNGAMARALEIDDCVDFLPIHPSASAVPALLALSEWQGGLSGRDFLTALAVGQDVIIRIGLAVRQNAMESGRYNLFKIFGPAAAVARAMKMNSDQVRNTLGISFTHAVADGQCALDGALTLRLQQGVVAQGALLSGMLAARGFTGAQNFLTGKFGYFVAHEPEPRLEYLTSGLGKKFWGEQITIKPFSSCRCTHSAIDLVLKIQQSDRITPHRVRRIVVHTAPEVHQLVAYPHDFRVKPDCSASAQFSIQYAVAASLVKGDFFLNELEPECLNNEEILTLADRVRVAPDESLRTRKVLGRTIVEMELVDGTTLRQDLEDPLGSPERPMSYKACARKLIKCAAYAHKPPAPGSLAELINQVAHLEEVEDVSRLLTLFC